MELTLQTTFDYPHYRLLIDELFSEGLSTTGDNNPDKFRHVKLNISRMNRIDKTYQPSTEIVKFIQQLPPMKWIALSEGWCGDSAQLVPVFAKLAALNPAIRLSILLRDQHPEVMDRHLTDGKRSIPKFVFIRLSDEKVLGEWGSRPAALQELVNIWLKEPGLEKEEREERIHTWYAKDKSLSVEKELIPIFAGMIS